MREWSAFWGTQAHTPLHAARRPHIAQPPAAVLSLSLSHT